jgi:hypothetical protein
MDDLQKFHEKNMAGDPQYAIARQLLDLGEAVARLREGAGLTRGQLGKRLRVKASDIAVVEEETPRAPAGGWGLPSNNSSSSTRVGLCVTR